MRTVRTASIAAATALSLAFGGVATAAETGKSSEPGQTENNGPVLFEGELTGDKPFDKVISEGTKGVFDGKGSSKYFNDTDKPFYGVHAFGKTTDATKVPQWARYWIDYTAVMGIISLIGLTVAGLNWAHFNGLLPF